MPLPHPNATTHPHTSPSVNDADRNTERGEGVNPRYVTVVRIPYMSYPPPPITDIYCRSGHSREVTVGGSGGGRGAIDAPFGEEGGLGGRGDGVSADGGKVNGDKEGV